MLLPADVAVQFERTEGWRKASSAAELLDLVTAYMFSKGIGRSSIDQLDVVEHILRLRRARAEERPQQLPSPEQAQWQANLREGTTANDAAMRAMDELSLNQQVAWMSMAEYSASRERLGVHQSTADFLLGR